MPTTTTKKGRHGRNTSDRARQAARARRAAAFARSERTAEAGANAR